jgi:hypothetical protein
MMERRGFLKLFGLGVVAVAASAATLTAAEAASQVVTPEGAIDPSVDNLLKSMTKAGEGEGEFAQYYIVRRRYYRPRYYRPVYYRRRYRCRTVWNGWRWVRRCW